MRAVQLPGVLAARGAAVEGRFQALGDEFLAHPRHRRRVDFQRPGDRRVGPRRPALALVGLQQDARVRQPPRRGDAAPHQRPQLRPLLIGQADRILGLSHRLLPFTHVV